MKYPVVIGITILFLALILAWMAVEWTAEKESRISPEGTAPVEAREPERKGRTEKSAVPTSSDEKSEPELESEAGLDERFDWRTPRDQPDGRTNEDAPEGRSVSRTSPDRTENARGPVEPSSLAASEQSGGQRRSSPARAAPAAVGQTAENPTKETPDPTPEKPRDPSEDREPPTLEWVRFTPEQAAAESEVLLAASATDDLAGVRDIVGRVTSPSGNAHIGFGLALNEATGTRETVIRIPENAEAGQWQISWFRMTDKANNSRDHRWTPASGPPGSSLTVTSPEGDGEPPILNSVSLDRPTMGPGETIQIDIRVTDEPSGVRFVSGTFQSPSGKAWAPFTASGDGTLWAGNVTVPEEGECGEWKLRRITAIDHANNQATWGSGDERIQGVSFYRSFSGQCDSDPPVVNRIEIRPRAVTNESDSKVEIIAFIDDLDSGVSNASGFAIAAEPAEAVPQRVHFVLKQAGEGPGTSWSGTITSPRHSMTGRWEVRALRVADEARNQRTYGPSDPVMADAWFVVE
ncbi:MAG: hypothetical protein R3338_12475 [Thermoanaerobaculia bacterium]|nr:hypothetical protein [Thermoanaerobaculia bacterium]